MEVGQNKKSNKWLVVVLYALVVLIIGLVIGIVVIETNENRDVESENKGIGVDEIISQWQEDIDSAQTDEEKYNAYMSVAIDLDRSIPDKEGEERSLYCDAIMEYVGKASEFAGDDDALIKAIKSSCIAEGESIDFQVEISGGEE